MPIVDEARLCDRQHLRQPRAASTWVEGEPKKSMWVGVKLDGKKPFEIETWRCPKCGFLENYASTETKRSAWA